MNDPGYRQSLVRQRFHDTTGNLENSDFVYAGRDLVYTGEGDPVQVDILFLGDGETPAAKLVSVKPISDSIGNLDLAAVTVPHRYRSLHEALKNGDFSYRGIDNVRIPYSEVETGRKVPEVKVTDEADVQELAELMDSLELGNTGLEAMLEEG